MPDSDASRAAERLCRGASPPALYAHTMRSFVYASLLADRDRERVDAEALYVGCVLHDMGLTPRHQHPSRPFEQVSAQVAVELTSTFGWPEARKRDLGRAIVLHMAEEIAASETAEARLLEAGVALDCTGRRLAEVEDRLHGEILRCFPRGPFKREFSALMQEEAERKPGCAAARLIRAGLIERIAAAPLP